MKEPRTILAIDPGNVQSALVWWREGKVMRAEILPNAEALKEVNSYGTTRPYSTDNRVVCEMIASYGMAVGETVFETCVWIGRFWSAADSYCPLFKRIFRKDIKLHLCGSMKAKDGNIRQALIDKLGAPGTKKNPGPTYGMKADLWAALAVAVTYDELNPL